MDHSLLRLLHLIGLMLVVMGLSGMAFAARAGFGSERTMLRRAAALFHGIGLLVIIATGFMMLPQLGYHGDPPTFVKIKLVIFLLLGGAISLAARWTRGIWIVLPTILFLCGFAAYLGVFKPF